MNVDMYKELSARLVTSVFYWYMNRQIIIVPLLNKRPLEDHS